MIEKIRIGLTAAQIKWVAVVFMTIDHLGAYGFEIPFFAAHYNVLRLLGRIAAPLFLYMVTESARHTRNRSKFIMRLYTAGVFTGLFSALTNCWLGDIVGIIRSGNIFFTFFYTVLYIHLLEIFIISLKENNIKHLVICFIAFVATYLPHLFIHCIEGIDVSSWNIKNVYLLQDVANSFLPRPLYVEYSLMFFLLGIAIYFSRKRTYQLFVYSIFCIMSYGGSILIPSVHTMGSIAVFFERPQYWMIMALPFMLLYNGKLGRKHKMFFYLYYPLHRYLISIIQALLT